MYHIIFQTLNVTYQFPKARVCNSLTKKGSAFEILNKMTYVFIPYTNSDGRSRLEPKDYILPYQNVVIIRTVPFCQFVISCPDFFSLSRLTAPGSLKMAYDPQFQESIPVPASISRKPDQEPTNFKVSCNSKWCLLYRLQGILSFLSPIHVSMR